MINSRNYATPSASEHIDVSQGGPFVVPGSIVVLVLEHVSSSLD
jgi:hypothetical protein